ncbi:unnamed protein product [Linum trigynum]|uniref:Uncharacterized protein n=1 Tax=Linum trigynum TaxID=586398 RepID=A0AAV2D2W0_9ROSI
MWAKFRASKIKKDHKVYSKSSVRDRGLNLSEEYHRTLRTQSYVAFFSKAQIMANHHHDRTPEEEKEDPILLLLLEPEQNSIPAILESAAVLSKLPELTPYFRDFFDSTAEASRICSGLLASVARTHATRRFAHQLFDEIPLRPAETESRRVWELTAYIAEANNPFSCPDGDLDFGSIREGYAAVLERLKSKRRKVARKIKLVECVNRGTGISITAACGVLAVTAAVLAAHTLTAFVMGPLAVAGGFNPVKKLVSRVMRFKVMTSAEFLRKLRRQLDMAAKGVYILNRDMDTVSRLVARLYDEVEHGKEMARFWLEKGKNPSDRTLFCSQVVNEMKRRDVKFRKQVDELEELMCLCLLTINRARGLVVEELTRSGSSTT